MQQTRGLIMAEVVDPKLIVGDFALVTLPAMLPFPPHRVESELTIERLAEMRAEVEREGFARGRLIYSLAGRRRVVDLETGGARWAGEDRPVPRARVA